MSSTKSVEYKNKYTALNYDRLNIFVPKGRKKDILRRAARKGTSINGLVCSLLQADLEFTDEQWKMKDE